MNSLGRFAEQSRVGPFLLSLGRLIGSCELDPSVIAKESDTTHVGRGEFPIGTLCVGAGTSNSQVRVSKRILETVRVSYWSTLVCFANGEIPTGKAGHAPVVGSRLKLTKQTCADSAQLRVWYVEVKRRGCATQLTLSGVCTSLRRLFAPEGAA